MSSDAGALVRGLYEAYQARDWERAASLLHAEVVVAMPATAERLPSRDSLMAFNRAYPEPWGDIELLRVVGDGAAEVAAELEVTAPDAVCRCVAFWRSRDGLLAEGVEYWVKVGGEQPPPYRRDT